MRPEDIDILSNELHELDSHTRSSALVVGWLFMRALRRVSGQCDVESADIGEEHWDILAGLAMCLTGCRGPVESLSALGWYSMHLGVRHLRDPELFAELCNHLVSPPPAVVKAIVVLVDAALCSPSSLSDSDIS